MSSPRNISLNKHIKKQILRTQTNFTKLPVIGRICAEYFKIYLHPLLLKLNEPQKIANLNELLTSIVYYPRMWGTFLQGKNIPASSSAMYKTFLEVFFLQYYMGVYAQIDISNYKHALQRDLQTFRKLLNDLKASRAELLEADIPADLSLRQAWDLYSKNKKKAADILKHLSQNKNPLGDRIKILHESIKVWKLIKSKDQQQMIEDLRVEAISQADLGDCLQQITAMHATVKEWEHKYHPHDEEEVNLFEKDYEELTAALHLASAPKRQEQSQKVFWHHTLKNLLHQRLAEECKYYDQDITKLLRASSLLHIVTLKKTLENTLILLEYAMIGDKYLYSYLDINPAMQKDGFFLECLKETLRNEYGKLNTELRAKIQACETASLSQAAPSWRTMYSAFKKAFKEASSSQRLNLTKGLQELIAQKKYKAPPFLSKDLPLIQEFLTDLMLFEKNLNRSMLGTEKKLFEDTVTNLRKYQFSTPFLNTFLHETLSELEHRKDLLLSIHKNSASSSVAKVASIDHPPPTNEGTRLARRAAEKIQFLSDYLRSGFIGLTLGGLIGILLVVTSIPATLGLATIPLTAIIPLTMAIGFFAGILFEVGSKAFGLLRRCCPDLGCTPAAYPQKNEKQHFADSYQRIFNNILALPPRFGARKNKPLHLKRVQEIELTNFTLTDRLDKSRPSLQSQNSDTNTPAPRIMGR